jgi:hypothetical protein
MKPIESPVFARPDMAMNVQQSYHDSQNGDDGPSLPHDDSR